MSHTVRCGCMCDSTNVKKTSVNPVRYIWIFVRPHKLVLRVDLLYTLFFPPGILCNIHACTKN